MSIYMTEKGYFVTHCASIDALSAVNIVLCLLAFGTIIDAGGSAAASAVSYTHLTLPTMAVV